MGGFVKKAIGYEEPPQQVQREAVKQEPRGPTKAEMDDKKRVGISRRGRRATILTSTKGVDEDLTLGTKTLLG
jgi:hypothetical protein